VYCTGQICTFGNRNIDLITLLYFSLNKELLIVIIEDLMKQKEKFINKKKIEQFTPLYRQFYYSNFPDLQVTNKYFENRLNLVLSHTFVLRLHFEKYKIFLVLRLLLLIRFAQISDFKVKNLCSNDFFVSQIVIILDAIKRYDSFVLALLWKVNKIHTFFGNADHSVADSGP
jgi:hypothetical protein